jgi:hypothetical protein
VSEVLRNRGGFVKCVAIQKRLGIPAVEKTEAKEEGSGRMLSPFIA